MPTIAIQPDPVMNNVITQAEIKHTSRQRAQK